MLQVNSLFESERKKFGPSWWLKLGYHFEMDYMQNTYNQLKQWSSIEAINPDKDSVYRQFKECDYDNVLVCFITKYPIVNYRTSDYWQLLSRQIENECNSEQHLLMEDNMDYLLKDGVFTLSMIRTTSFSKDHSLLWKEFSKTVLEWLNKSGNKIMFVYDKDTEDYANLLDKSWHSVVPLEKGTLLQVNSFVKQNYNQTIKWI